MVSSTKVRRRQQSFNHLAIFKVRFDDFIDVLRVDIAVPDRFGVNHDNRSSGAAVEATRFVDAHLPRAGQAGGLDL